MNSTNHAFAIIKATHTAPHKGPPRVVPATDYAVWDLAKEKFARKGRYEH